MTIENEAQLARAIELLHTCRTLLQNAITDHIYDQANGDKVPADCPFTGAVRDIDALVGGPQELPALDYGHDDEEEGETTWTNHYRCPRCGHVWQDTWTAQCDDDCGECGTRHITPFFSDDGSCTIEQRDQALRACEARIPLSVK